MTSLADKAILSGTDNRPPMLEKDMYDSWKSRMELYMLNRQHGRMILESVESDLLLWPTVEENAVTRLKKYSELSITEAIQADCDVKATNIILQGLPPNVYALVNTDKVAKELWERIQMLMQGTSLTKQERECKLYDEFDKFAYRKGESLYPLALVAHHQMNKSSAYASQAPSSTPLSLTYPSNDFQSSVNHNVYNPSSLMPHVEYAPAVHQQSEFFPPEIGLVVLVFQKELLMMVLVMHTEENDTVFHTEKTGMLILMVEIDVDGVTADVVDKLTCSSDDVQPKQVDPRCAHALIELHWQDIHVVPDRHEVDQR
nr:retrovirus-related Pol polyprotein from transposon TNT 1-94 [Tanacetum cinerariifolium]